MFFLSEESCLTFQQCFGSGSALIWLSWIRIRIVNADPNWERGSGSGSRSMGPINYFQYIFHVKFEHFVTIQYGHDPDLFGYIDPDPESDPHGPKKLDPDPDSH
jgi:hypothetical protein